MHPKSINHSSRLQISCNIWYVLIFRPFCESTNSHSTVYFSASEQRCTNSFTNLKHHRITTWEAFPKSQLRVAVMFNHCGRTWVRLRQSWKMCRIEHTDNPTNSFWISVRISGKAHSSPARQRLACNIPWCRLLAKQHCRLESMEHWHCGLDKPVRHLHDQDNNWHQHLPRQSSTWATGS